MERPDDALRGSVVADCPPRGLDAAGQCGLADEPVTPHLVEQLDLGDHAVAVAEQMDEYVEDLRLDSHRSAVATQLTPLGIELAAVEGETRTQP